MKKTKRSDSLLQSDKYCYLCMLLEGRDNVRNLECHHCFHGTANRKHADRLGLWIWLCPEHHRTGVDAVHRDAEIDLRIKRIAQAYYEMDASKEEFIAIFGKNYL